MTIAHLPIEQRNSEIVRLAQERLRPREISERTGVRIYTVYGVIAQARRDGEDIPKFATGVARPEGERVMRLGPDLTAALDGAAEQRGITVQTLARRLLEAICDDGLIDAVLDDGEAVE